MFIVTILALSTLKVKILHLLLSTYFDWFYILVIESICAHLRSRDWVINQVFELDCQ